MTTKDKYDQVFVETFSVSLSQLSHNPVYNQIPSWDSIGHMALVSALETVFGISMETEDVVSFGSYKQGMDILAKYGVRFDS